MILLYLLDSSRRINTCRR